jgi:hypothetical protein
MSQTSITAEATQGFIMGLGCQVLKSNTPKQRKVFITGWGLAVDDTKY